MPHGLPIARMLGRPVLLGGDRALLAFDHLLRLILGVDEPIARVGDRSDELVELEVRRFRVAVLGVLDQENHEERHGGRADD